MLSTFLIVCCFIFYFYVCVFKKFSSSAYVVACVCEGDPFLLSFVYIPVVCFIYYILIGDCIKSKAYVIQQIKFIITTCYT
jgi:hypothetical protein